jgi:hypothetical protein
MGSTRSSGSYVGSTRSSNGSTRAGSGGPLERAQSTKAFAEEERKGRAESRNTPTKKGLSWLRGRKSSNNRPSSASTTNPIHKAPTTKRELKKRSKGC